MNIWTCRFRFLGARKTPLRPQEFWFEAITVLLVATAVIAATLWVFRRLRVLESFVQVCAWCRKVNVDDDWVSFEEYLKRELDVRSTHGICPTCRANASKRPATATPSILNCSLSRRGDFTRRTNLKKPPPIYRLPNVTFAAE